MKNRFNSYSEAKVETQLEQDAQALDSGQRRGKQPLKLEYGHNVLWWIPSVNPRSSMAWRHVLLHWNPLHVCSRSIVEDPNDSNKYIIERNYDRCYRCSQAWKHHDDAGRSDESYETQYKHNRSKHHVAMCAVNLSPFFMTKNASDPYSRPNQPIIDAHMDSFLDIVEAVSLGQDPVVKDGTPEDVVKAAKQGIGILLVSKDIGTKCRDAFKKKFVEIGEEDPLQQPENTLLQISRQRDPSRKWESGGVSRDSTVYSAGFLPLNAKTWTFPERLYQILEKVFEAGLMPDIWTIGEEDTTSEKTVREKAVALSGLSNAEMKEYLLEMKHEFVPTAKTDEQTSETETAQPATAPSMATSPELDAVLDSEDTQDSVRDLRARLNKAKS